jgi:hypothetical protein
MGMSDDKFADEFGHEICDCCGGLIYDDDRESTGACVTCRAQHKSLAPPRNKFWKPFGLRFERRRRERQPKP